MPTGHKRKKNIEGAHFQFQRLVHFYHNGEHGGMQADVLEMRVLHIAANRKSIEQQNEGNMKEKKLQTLPPQ